MRGPSVGKQEQAGGLWAVPGGGVRSEKPQLLQAVH